MSKLSEIFGRPGEGIHRHRFLGVAVVDVLMTIAGSYVLSRMTKMSFQDTTVLMFLIGIVAHRIFGVRTAVDKLIFSNHEDDS